MKLPCEMIQDLIPLYEEELCSPATRSAVEEHFQECEQCRRQVEQMRKLSANDREEEHDPESEEAAVVRSFRKIHRRWLQSLLCVFLIIPMLLLTVNQWRGEGICFTNPDDIWAVRRFVTALEKGDFEKAAACMNYEELYREVQSLKVPYPKTVGENYTTAVLSDKSWVVTKDFFDEYLRWEEREIVIWENLIYNHVGRAMIPEKIWQEVTAAEPDMVEETEEKEYVVNGHIYMRLDTKWGIFIATKNSGLEKCVTAADFCNVLELIPEEIYKEAYPQIEEQALTEYYETKEMLEKFASMTLEEFTESVQTDYIEDLSLCANKGITFENTGYQESFWTKKGGWDVTYGLLVNNNGQKIPITVSFQVCAGKLQFSGMGYQELFAGKEMVSEALSVNYFE